MKAQRFDPYKNFKFKVSWADDKGSKVIAGVSKVGALKRTTKIVEHRSGGDPSSSRKSPGRTEYEPIMLERGVTFDKEFEQWANKTWNYDAVGEEVSLADFRRSLKIELHNEAGQVVIVYNVYRCWVSEFTALPDLDANGEAIAIQSIQLQNEGWERDYDYKPLDEPSFLEPSA
jgi:phage tail-like protein